MHSFKQASMSIVTRPKGVTIAEDVYLPKKGERVDLTIKVGWSLAPHKVLYNRLFTQRLAVQRG